MGVPQCSLKFHRTCDAGLKMVSSHCALFCLWVVSCSVDHVSNQKTPLHIGGMSVISNHWWIHARAFPYVIESAFEDVNNSTDILADYELHLDMEDDQGQPGLGIKALYKYISATHKTLMLIGPAKSEPAVAVSQAASAWNLVSVLYSAKSSELTDRSKFPNVYRINQNENNFNPLRVALMLKFGWERVITITQAEEPFMSQMSDFQQRLKVNNLTLVTAAVLTQNDNEYIGQQIQRLTQYNSRIIVANINDMYVRQVFCEALHAGLTGHKYVWLLMNWAASSGWPEFLHPVWGTPPDSRCTVDQLHEAANGYIGMEHKYLSDSTLPTVSGLTPQEIDDRAWARYAHFIPDNELPHNHPHAYDAAWAIALALNRSVETLMNINKTLADFTYESKDMADIFKSSMEEISFDGASGPVSFDADGTRMGIAYVTQWKNRKMHEVGSVNERTGEQIWYKSTTIQWPNNSPPKDSFSRVIEDYQLPVGLQWTLTALALIGIIVAVGLLVFNVYYRNEKIIKMSSPNLNNLILSGAILMYLVVVVTGIDRKYVSSTTAGILCNAPAWMAAIAFTTAFGSMFSKIWRVHVLFANKKLEKKVIKDWRLFFLVSTLVLCDLLVLVLWVTLDPSARVHVTLPDEILDDDTIIIWTFATCRDNYGIWFSAAFYSYKGLLLILGSFLAWETRKVSIPGLNDSKSIGMCVYNVTVLCAFAVPLNHVLREDQFVITYGLTSGLILFCTTLILTIVFYPKVMMKVNKVEVGRFQQDGSVIGETRSGVSGMSQSIRHPDTTQMTDGFSTAES